MRYIEKNLLDCWLAMDLNLEVLTSRLSETGRYWSAALFGEAHRKLLSVFDEGCENFYACHKFFANYQLAHSYRKMGDKEKCLHTLRTLATCLSHVKTVETSENFSVSARNPSYFGCIDVMEEYLLGFNADGMLGAFDAFFGEDETYLAVKADIMK